MGSLVGGGDNRGLVVRVGDTVRRPQSFAAPSVHRLLDHLQTVGFEGAPRFLGVDERDREILSFIPGDVPVPLQPPDDGWRWIDADAVESVGALLGRFHAAVSEFRAPPDAVWRGGPPSRFSGSMVCHNDPVVGNIVFRDGRAVALVDFDDAAPGDPIWDVAIAAQHWVPLGDPVDFVGGDARQLPERLARLLDAYARPVDTGRLFDAVETYLERGREGVAARVRAGERAFVEYWDAGLGDRLARAQQWVADNRRTFR